MQQIYRRRPIPKCDFNKVAKQFALQHACSPESLPHIFRIILPRNTYGWLLLDWKWLCSMYFEINITTSVNNDSRSPKKASFCGSIRWAQYQGIFLYSILFNSLFYFHNLVWEFKIFTRCSWKWETQRVNTCLKLAMISLESSMSLNIPSNLLVKALPHSKKKSKNHYPFFKNIVLNFTKFDALWLSLWCLSLFSFIELGAHRQIVNTDGAL